MKFFTIALGLVALATAPVSAQEDNHAGGDVQLGDFDKIVVIYQENHSFDNLYGLWDAVGEREVNGLRALEPIEHSRLGAPWAQIRAAADGSEPYLCLPQNDVNLTSPAPLAASCKDHTAGAGAPISSAFYNRPFKIDDFIATNDTTCPAPGVFAPNGVAKGQGLAGGCTRDIVHRFYSEQYQINGGQQDRYVTGSDAMGLVMGYYDTRKLPLYKYLHQPGAPKYVIEDNFFQAAFGGSFLNHQWLIAAKTPVFVDPVTDGSGNDLHSVVDANGMPTKTPLYSSTDAATAATLRDRSLTAYCAGDSRNTASLPPAPGGVACGDYAVNTTQPKAWPYAPGTVDAKRLPPLADKTIGDLLNDKVVDWAWYSGGWDNAEGNTSGKGWTNGVGGACSDPNANPQMVGGVLRCPDKNFQYHHQAFNYFAAYAPGTDARKAHLLDEAEFIDAARNGKLKAVSFVKPLGADNEHPGYASEATGSNHLVALVDAIVKGPDARKTLIIVTYDEFGGAWDHVPPPPHNVDKSAPSDQWGPGTRIPALVISARFRRSGVDSHAHDTTSVLKLIEERFGLPSLSSRDAAVRSLSTAVDIAR